jgi:hypothetical protein
VGSGGRFWSGFGEHGGHGLADLALRAGFAASAMFTTVQLQHALVAPDTAYYLFTAAGIAASLGIVAATFPLLRRITGPEAARNE